MGKAIEQVAQDVDRNYWMSAEEAKAYGIVDEIIDKKVKGRPPQQAGHCSVCCRYRSQRPIIF